MDNQTMTLTMEFLAALGLLMIWIGPQLPGHLLVLFYVMLAAIGFILTFAGSHLGSSPVTSVAMLFTAPGLVLSILLVRELRSEDLEETENEDGGDEGS